MVVDSFTVFNEARMLDLRVRALKEHVDVFVAVEGTHTFRGQQKTFSMRGAAEAVAARHGVDLRFVTTDNFVSQTASPWDREAKQRNGLRFFVSQVGLVKFDKDDVFVFGDVDEIPDPRCFGSLVAAARTHGVVVPKMRLRYYRLDCELDVDFAIEQDFDYGVVFATWDVVHVTTPEALRQEVRNSTKAKVVEGPGPRIPPAWHFSFCYPRTIAVENARRKIESFSHAEHDHHVSKSEENLSAAYDGMRDLFGRDLRFKSVGRSTLPKEILAIDDVLEREGLLVST